MVNEHRNEDEITNGNDECTVDKSFSFGSVSLATACLEHTEVADATA
jgi:hypothetical protein